jgi:hypothetical protein
MSEVCVESVTSKFHKMLERLPFLIRLDLPEVDLWSASILAHLLAFFSAARLLKCTMSRLMRRTGGTGIQCRAPDMLSQVRRTKTS